MSEVGRHGDEALTYSLTSRPDKEAAQPMFLSGTKGNLFALYFTPDPLQYQGHDVLVLPAFAEEMNKSRRMVSLLGRRLQRLGIGMLVVDLYGTGDSAGNFSDARLDIWESDIGTAAAWLKSQGTQEVGILAIRFGALLSLHATTEIEHLTRIIYWQPVVRGDTMITQFLRVRTSAAVHRNGGSTETTNDLRAALARGDDLEIGGYVLNSELACAIDHTRIDHIHAGTVPSISWMELLISDSLPVPPVSRAVADAWRRAGIDVTLEAITSPPFWAGQNITIVPTLLEKTTALFSKSCQ